MQRLNLKLNILFIFCKKITLFALQRADKQRFVKVAHPHFRWATKLETPPAIGFFENNFRNYCRIGVRRNRLERGEVE